MATKKSVPILKILAGPVFAGLAGLVVGYLLFSPPKQPEYSVVWSFENSAKIPPDLYNFLVAEGKKGCNDYRGTNTTQGTHLAAVHKVVDERYAWVDIGCERISNENADFPVVKYNGNWKLISAARYWMADTNGNRYPRCDVVDEFKISKQFAPTCTTASPDNMPPTSSPLPTRQVQYE